MLDNTIGCSWSYIRECTKLLIYKAFSKYPCPLVGWGRPLKGRYPSPRAGTCQVEESVVGQGPRSLIEVFDHEERIDRGNRLMEAIEQLEAWISEQVQAGLLVRHRDGSVSAKRKGKGRGC